jgi:hypothetical protein
MDISFPPMSLAIFGIGREPGAFSMPFLGLAGTTCCVNLGHCDIRLMECGIKGAAQCQKNDKKFITFHFTKDR